MTFQAANTRTSSHKMKKMMLCPPRLLKKAVSTYVFRYPLDILRYIDFSFPSCKPTETLKYNKSDPNTALTDDQEHEGIHFESNFRPSRWVSYSPQSYCFVPVTGVSGKILAEKAPCLIFGIHRINSKNSNRREGEYLLFPFSLPC